MIIVITLVFILIIAYDAPPLVKNKMWRELAAFGVLMLIGVLYSYGQVINLPLPNPALLVEAVFKPVGEYLDKMLY